MCAQQLSLSLTRTHQMNLRIEVKEMRLCSDMMRILTKLNRIPLAIDDTQMERPKQILKNGKKEIRFEEATTTTKKKEGERLKVEKDMMLFQVFLVFPIRLSVCKSF